MRGNKLPDPEYLSRHDYVLVDEDRSPFDDFDAPGFERWLQVGLEGHLLDGQGTWAFPGAEGHILRSGHLVEGLTDAYRGMRPQQRAAFRQAVADLLASPALEASPHNVPVLEHLLSLAEALPAPEVLRVLPARLATAQKKALFSLSLLTAARLAAERDDAVECLKALIGSKNFNLAYSGIALVALCRADGRGLAAHMQRLRKPLASMFREYHTPPDARRELARTILAAVGLERLVSALPNLKYFDPSAASAATDGWLIEDLLAGPTPPVRCTLIPQGNTAETIEPVFRRTCEPEVLYPLPQGGPGRRDLLDLLRDRALMGSEADDTDGAEHRGPIPVREGETDPHALARQFGLSPDALEEMAA